MSMVNISFFLLCGSMCLQNCEVQNWWSMHLLGLITCTELCRYIFFFSSMGLMSSHVFANYLAALDLFTVFTCLSMSCEASNWQMSEI